VGVRRVGGAYELTEGGAAVDAAAGGDVTRLLQYGGPLKEGAARVLYGVAGPRPLVAVTALGGAEAGHEGRDGGREAVRRAAAAGLRALEEAGASAVAVDGCGDAAAAAEGATLAAFRYQACKARPKPQTELSCLTPNEQGWEEGVELAAGQNLARHLMEAPANLMTPTRFAEEARAALEPLGVTVQARGEAWARERGMGAFLAVARGSAEPLVFLELGYAGAGAGEGHLAFVGKGVTFDSGGISIKPSKGMEDMRADMGGAACVVGALRSVAALKVPLNVRAYIPLCENMPGGKAIKPGDIVTAANGKTIQIDNTDAEGRLLLADALHHACLAGPLALIDVATLTGAMRVALGHGAAGAFTGSDGLWRGLEGAGRVTGDRLWRMPLWRVYSDMVDKHGNADLNNIGSPASAGSCTAAAFLSHFVSTPNTPTSTSNTPTSTPNTPTSTPTSSPTLPWAHVDIAGVMDAAEHGCFLGKGMTGRPTRTLAAFAQRLARGEVAL